MAKFPLDEDQIYDFLKELESNVGKCSDDITERFLDNFQDYSERYCSQAVDENIIRFVTLCVQDSYLLALRTFQEGLKKTLLPDFDSSDETD